MAESNCSSPPQEENQAWPVTSLLGHDGGVSILNAFSVWYGAPVRSPASWEPEAWAGADAIGTHGSDSVVSLLNAFSVWCGVPAGSSAGWAVVAGAGAYAGGTRGLDSAYSSCMYSPCSGAWSLRGLNLCSQSSPGGVCGLCGVLDIRCNLLLWVNHLLTDETRISRSDGILEDW